MISLRNSYQETARNRQNKSLAFVTSKNCWNYKIKDFAFLLDKFTAFV